MRSAVAVLVLLTTPAAAEPRLETYQAASALLHQEVEREVDLKAQLFRLQHELALIQQSCSTTKSKQSADELSEK